MRNNNSPLISAKDLLQRMNDENLIIVDASNGKESKKRYEKEHILDAIHVDLETQLSSIKKDPTNGGRHPLPKEEVFAITLSSLGIHPYHDVVIYDDNNGGVAAARFWWMLKSYGHKNVQVLNGGLTSAKSAGITMSSEVRKIEKTEYPISNWNLPLIEMNDVEKASLDSKSLIIDVRSPERYAGINEPIDLKAGHIPSAINIPFAENMGEDGKFKSIEEIKEMYASVLDAKNEIIIHCGSGVTACHTILALNSAGFDFPKLYVGSWSEWSRREV